MDKSKGEHPTGSRSGQKRSLQGLFESPGVPALSGKSKRKPASDQAKKHKIEVPENSRVPQEDEEKQNRKKRASKEPHQSAWKRVKLSEDMAFKESGFFMLEELAYDPTIPSSDYDRIMRSVPIVPANLESEPVVDTVDSDLDTAMSDEENHQTEKPKKQLRISGTKTIMKKMVQTEPIKQKKNSASQADHSTMITKVKEKEEGTQIEATTKQKQKQEAPKLTKGDNESAEKREVKNGEKEKREDYNVLKIVDHDRMDVDELQPSEKFVEETYLSCEEENEIEAEEEAEEDGDDAEDDADDETVDNSPSQFKKAHIFIPQEEMDDVDLPSWTSVYPFHKRLLLALKDLGYTDPTNIQKAVMPVALGKRLDLIGASQTGSGKTLAFGLPILHQILEVQEKSQKLGHPRDSTIKALILSPTRELAVQIVDHLKQVSTHAYIKIAPVIGGISVTKQTRYLRKKPDILVATPGRLWELISSGLMEDAQNSLADLRWLVFDEADKMVEFGRFTELANILRTVYDSRKRKWSDLQRIKEVQAKTEEMTTNEMNIDHPNSSSSSNTNSEIKDAKKDLDLNKASYKKNQQQVGGPKPLQTFIFSATMSIGPEARMNLKNTKRKNNPLQLQKQKLMMSRKKAKSLDTKESEPENVNSQQMFEKLMDQIDFQREVELVDITTATHQVSTLEEAKIFCLHDEKDFYLYYFLTRYHGKSIIFVNAISNIKRLLPLMVILRIPAFGMHAHMDQHHRLKNLEKFKSSQNAVLITTDVLARGVDIPQVDHVIHYSIPASAEVFVHRSGRTARAFATGLCIHIVDPEDKRHYASIMSALGRSEVPDFPVDMSLYTAAKKRVKLAAELDSLSHENQKKSADAQWLIAKAKDLDAEIPDDLLSSDDEATTKQKAYEKSKRKIRYNQVKSQLRELLSQPMIGRGSSLAYTSKPNGAAQLFAPNSTSFQTPPSSAASSAVNDTDQSKTTTGESPFVASSSAFQDVLKTKGTKHATKSSNMIEKLRVKRKLRLQSKQGLSGPKKRN